MTVPVVGRCKAPGCGVEMISQSVWLRRPELRERYRRHNAYGLCDLCYARARRAGTLPEPAPPRPEPLPDVDVKALYTITCEKCGDVGTTVDHGYAHEVRRRHREQHKERGAA
jgi:hypothetical protein